MSINNFDPITIVILLAALSLLPMLLVCTTCFLKVSIVLNIVRNAIGVQQVPPSIAMYSIALAVTMFIMAPVAHQISQNFQAEQRHSNQKVSLEDIAIAVEPMRRFMTMHTLPEQRAHFLNIARKQWPKADADALRDTDYVVLIPAFMISELQLAFEVGFVIYIPFVVIDLLMSNVLLALGMQMVSPMVVSLPLKMLLFIMLDGWNKLIDGLITSYG